MRSMAQIVRITLFPPNADRVSQLVNSYVLDEHGVLHYRDSEGTEYQTTDPLRDRAPGRGMLENSIWRLTSPILPAQDWL